MSAPQSNRAAEAARWFAALRRGVMSLEERAAYEAWRRDRANRAACAEIETAWQAVALLEAPLRGQARTDSKPTRDRVLARPALVAAMCVLSLGIGVLSYSGHSQFWTALDWTAR